MPTTTGRAHGRGVAAVMVAACVSLGAVVAPACGDFADTGGTGLSGADTHESGASESGTNGETGTTGGTRGSGSDTGDGGDGPRLDVGYETEDAGDSGGVQSCEVGDDGDAPPPCEDEAPPNSFDPDVQWSFAGEGDETQAVVSPIVANLTDDNGDGAIDLCDIPDVIVTLYASEDPDGPNPYRGDHGHVYVLDGATGALHFKIPQIVDSKASPAVGDIDNDGLPEIVTTTAIAPPTDQGHLIAFNHDGSLLWEGDSAFKARRGSVALADMDNDGDVEIGLRGVLSDHTGKLLWESGRDLVYINVMADLDGDDDLELIVHGRALHHDGSRHFSTSAFGNPQVADLDDDGRPEVLVVGDGMTLIEHDGTVTYKEQFLNLAQRRPAAIHDVDGDGAPEILVGSDDRYSVLDTDLTAKWTRAVHDNSGNAGGTAFDFLGDGSAEAMYADETALFIFEGRDGTQLLTADRHSWTLHEYPVVADVDNDGSAEIVVVSNVGYIWNPGPRPPAVQVIRDKQDRWVGARRIWNQHTYHVTNVREDGTIPQFEKPHWERLNTFRTQAQINGDGGTCKPQPEG